MTNMISVIKTNHKAGWICSNGVPPTEPIASLLNQRYKSLQTHSPLFINFTYRLRKSTFHSLFLAIITQLNSPLVEQEKNRLSSSTVFK